MKTKIVTYNVILKKERKYWVSYVPTLGISDFGKTLEEAKQNVRLAIECHIEGLVKTGDEVPTPDEADFFLSQSKVTLPKNIKFAY